MIVSEHSIYLLFKEIKIFLIYAKKLNQQLS
jgi:hypothetical protein